MKNIFFLISYFIFTVSSSAQDSINYKGENINMLDQNNNQTGIWKIIDKKNKILISCDFKEGKLVSDTKFYKNSKLIASYNNLDKLEIYKDSKTIVCNYFRKGDNSLTLIDENKAEIDSDIISFYTQAADVKPMFYGGINKLNNFIWKNIKKNKVKIKGTVIVHFVIDTKGFVTKIEIVESTDSRLNDEILRVVSMIPRWQPGFFGGKFAQGDFNLPITFL